jgi:hypothetical protein
MTEEEARLSHICPGCGQSKELDLVVCWTCFKYRKDKVPFKYYDANTSNPLQEWLDYIKS